MFTELRITANKITHLGKKPNLNSFKKNSESRNKFYQKHLGACPPTAATRLFMADGCRKLQLAADGPGSNHSNPWRGQASPRSPTFPL